VVLNNQLLFREAVEQWLEQQEQTKQQQEQTKQQGCQGCQ
jgi:hypothetical protein